MQDLSPDARRTLQALIAIQTRGGGERQSHTDRAIMAQAGLDTERTKAALEELASEGYVVGTSRSWEGPPTLTTFRLEDKGRPVVG